MRATPSTSPFVVLQAIIMASVDRCIAMRPWARAMRCVSTLAPTSTMCARPPASKWVSFFKVCSKSETYCVGIAYGTNILSQCGQPVTDGGNHRLPVPERVLPEQLHRRIPGHAIPGAQVAPFRAHGNQYPCAFAERTGQMAD